MCRTHDWPRAEIAGHAAHEKIDSAAGKMLSDTEFAKAVLSRADIFYIERGIPLFVAETAALVCAVLAGIWLSTRPIEEIPAGFLLRVFPVRTVSLSRDFFMESPSRPRERDMPVVSRPVPGLLLRDGMPEAGAAGIRPAERDTREQVSAAGYPPYRETEETGMQEESGVDYPREEARAHEIDETEPLHAFRRALEKNPRDAEALVGVGRHFFRTGRLDSASLYYFRGLDENPDNCSAWNDLGSIHHFRSTMAANPHYARRTGITDPVRYGKMLYDSAVAAYTNAFSRDSSFVEALTNRGVIHEINGNRDDALKDYTLAIRLNPSYASACKKRGDMRRQSKKYAEAIEDYTAAIRCGDRSYRFNPAIHFANAYFSRGTTYYRMTDYKKAIEDFDSALSINPGHRLAMLNKGIALGRMKKHDRARDLLTRAIQTLSPAEYDGARMIAYMHRGNAFKESGMYEEAIADFKNARTKPDLAARACWRIAQCYSLLKEYESAILWLRESVSHGFSDFDRWKRDRDLAPLRNTAAFMAITG